MRKLVFAIICLLSMIPITTVNAVELPVLGKANKPLYYSVEEKETEDNKYSKVYSYSIIDDETFKILTEYNQDEEAFLKKYNITSYDIAMELVLSIGSDDNFKYDDNWDDNWSTFNDKELIYRIELSDSKIIKSEILNTDTWYDTYETLLESDPDIFKSDSTLIDFDNKSIYVKARYLVVYKDNEHNSHNYYTDFSDLGVYGKDSTFNEDDLVVNKLKAPVLNNLVFNEDELSIYYNITNDTEAFNLMLKSYFDDNYQYGNIIVEYRINDGDWQIGYMANPDWLFDGNRAISLEDDIKITDKVEIRCKYTYTYNGEEIKSDYSNIISNQVDTTNEEQLNNNQENVEKCLLNIPFCCTTFLGISICIWILIAIIIIIFTIVFIVIKNKKRRKK